MTRLTVHRLLDGRNEQVGRDNHADLCFGARLAGKGLLQDLEQSMTERCRDKEAVSSELERLVVSLQEIDGRNAGSLFGGKRGGGIVGEDACDQF